MPLRQQQHDCENQQLRIALALRQLLTDAFTLATLPQDGHEQLELGQW